MIPVFDIECREWVLPIAVGLYHKGEYREFLKLNDDWDVVWEFLEYLKKNCEGIKLYAHYASHYDTKFVLDSLTRHKQTVRFPAGLSRLVWVEPNISFEDSYQVLGRGLAAACEAFNVPRKLEWEHSETKNPWEMPEDKLTVFRAYLKRDCTSLSQALDAWAKELLDRFGITPSSTLSLTAVKAFDKKYYPVEDIASNLDFENFIRKATYGGRNEVYKRYGEGINFYDIKGMFVSCYDVPVPIGKMHWTTPDIDKGTLAEAKVKVPDLLIGPLPYRHQGHLIFPVGEFQSWWDMRELRNATKYGVDLTIIRQLECDEESVLNSFKEEMETLRSIPNHELNKIWKIFGLRLSGKFGQHRTKTEIRHISEIEDFTGYLPIDNNEIYHEKAVLLNRKSPYVKPAINMRIRAEARIRHLNSLLEVEDIYYCDTDSIYTTSKLPTGKALGDLQLVDFARRAYFIGCKCYGYINKVGALRQKTSGFSDAELTEYEFKKLLKGEEVLLTFSSLGNWRDTLKGKGVFLVEKARTVRSTSGNRLVSGLDTYPIRLP